MHNQNEKSTVRLVSGVLTKSRAQYLLIEVKYLTVGTDFLGDIERE